MSFLAGIGGKNLRNLTTNILRRIILDEVAELYSLTGKQMKNSNKKSFLNTEVFKLIFRKYIFYHPYTLGIFFLILIYTK